MRFGTTEFPDIESLRSELKQGRIAALGEITTQYSGIPPKMTDSRRTSL